MRVIKLTAQNKHKVLHQALEVINRGGTIVYPTETAYALGGDFFSPEAYQKIFAIKGRPKDKIFPVIVPDEHLARILVRFSVKAQVLAKQYWPGPLTLVLPLKHKKLQHTAFKSKTLALRVSSHPIAHILCRLAARPLIVTSANVSGKPAVYDIKRFLTQMRQRKFVPDLVIDAGPLPEVFPSTIVKLTNSHLEVLRQGQIVVT
ncbi:MAG: L-threonylcarbamoyladenylate synthase [Candidatus Komeilibacteria bacterium]